MPRVALFVLLLSAAVVSAQPAKAILLNVQKGDLPSDASAPVALTTDFPEVPDGVSLKVTFGEGAFGQYNPRLKDWSGFATVKFFAHNASEQPLQMYFALRDKEPVSYENRADIPFTLQPGPNNVSLDLTRIKRTVNPLPVDLSSVTQWYIAKATEGGEYVVYFGDIILESLAPTPAQATPAAPAELTLTSPTAGGAKIVIEGRIRIEMDELTFRSLVAGLAPPAPGAAPAAGAAAPVAPAKKKLMLVDLTSGQMPFEVVEGATAELTDEHAAELGGKAVKVTFTKPGAALSMGYWGMGAFPATNWTGYNFLRFEAFNASDKILDCYLAVRDQNPGYENRADFPLRLTPGLNKVELPISTIVTHAGKQLDKAHITHWFIPCDQQATVYFANFRVEE